MTTSTKQTPTEPIAVRVTAETLSVDLSDGRTISVPTEWFPRLAHGSPAEWAHHELTYDAVHWPDLNEDVPVEGMLRGERSGESLRSIKRWLDLRQRGQTQPVAELPLPADLAGELEQIKANQGCKPEVG